MSRVVTRFSRHGQWFHENGASAIGAAFVGNNLMQGRAFASRLTELAENRDILDYLQELNGFFSFVAQSKHGLVAAVDRVRSYPLFYALAHNQVFISDSAAIVQEAIHAEANPEAEEEFLLLGYVTGSNTLFTGVQQLQAGEALVIRFTDDDRDVALVRHSSFIRQESSTSDVKLLTELVEQTIESATSRLIEWANGRTIVLPLSGGYDSRLIASELKRVRYENVITYTYGTINSREVKRSKAVAQALGFRWEFVPYNTELWRGWYRTEECTRYLDFAHNLVSVPHLQDWPAIWELRRESRIPTDAVIVPGHTGDMIAGGHTLREFVAAESVAAAELLEAIYRRHYTLWPAPASAKKPMIERIGASLSLDWGETFSGTTAVALHDRWNWQERQAKFIVNSVRVYEFWGYDWWLPLWDNQVVDLWETIVLNFRVDQSLYNSFVSGRYSRISGLDLQEAAQTDRINWLVNLKKRIKGTGLEGSARSIMKLGRKVLHDPYKHHPLAWYGIVEKRRFQAAYTGTETINSFLVRDIIDGHHAR